MEPFRLSRNDTVTLIRSLITVQTEDYPLGELLSDFKKEVGYPIPTFGHRTVLNFLNSIPGTLRVFSENNNLYVRIYPYIKSSYIGVVFMKSGLLPQDERKALPTSGKPNESQLHDSGEPNILKSGKQNKSGKKNEKKNKKAQISDLTLTSISDEEKEGKGKPAKKVQKICTPFCNNCEHEVHSVAEPVVGKFLSTIVIFKDSIPFLNLAYFADIGDDIEISVSEVCNPHKFFLQLKRQRNELLKVMGSMQAFYSVYGSKYTVEKYEFRKGQFCAVLYNTNSECREWYRGMMVNFGPVKSVVFLIDYGTTAEVSNTDLKYLDRSFGQLPRQAIHGRLANVKPYDGRLWSEKCCKTFYKIVFEQEIVASIVSIDLQKRMLSMYISYGERGELRIHNALLRDKLAIFDRSIDMFGAKPSYTFESGHGKGFIRPEDIGKMRNPRVTD